MPRAPATAFALLAVLAAVAADDGPSLSERVRALGDAVPAVRENALVALMGLDPSRLPALRDTVARAGRLRPEQAEALRTAGVHVLAHEQLSKLPGNGRGFLGVLMADAAMEDPDDPDPGVLIIGTLPGFVGERELQVGDRLMAVTEAGHRIAIASQASLADAIGGKHPGTPVTLDVMRGASRLSIDLRLDGGLFVEPTVNRAEQTRSIRQMADDAHAAAEWGFATQFAGVAMMAD